MTRRDVEDLTGRRYGKMVVLERAESGRNGKARWRVACDCGNERVFDHTWLLRDIHRSCGCNKNKSPIFRQWQQELRDRAAVAIARGERPCSSCGTVKPLSEFHRNGLNLSGVTSNCKTCRADAHAKRRYGISLSDKARLIAEQGGRCAIHGCGSIVDDSSAVDHCHESGQVRAVLCTNCNTALGMLMEDVRRIEGLASYARSWKQLKLIPGGRTS